jgi:hypothetical protein
MKMIVNILVLITLLTSITYANQKIITDDNEQLHTHKKFINSLFLVLLMIKKG